MGPSGSGKTTLLLMLGAMLRPTSGSVVIDGVDLATAPERRLPRCGPRHLGFIFQDFNLLSALTARENVELACNLAGTVGRAARHRATDLLGRVGLGHRLDFRPDQLSGGEKQRVAIARALANNPTVLLADEPTANLDSGHGREIARLLRRLAEEDGRSIVIVSHDDRSREVADRVLWLEDGAFRELAAMVTDPVCGMAVEPAGNPHRHPRRQTWWFCSCDGCAVGHVMAACVAIVATVVGLRLGPTGGRVRLSRAVDRPSVASELLVTAAAPPGPAMGPPLGHALLKRVPSPEPPTPRASHPSSHWFS